MRNISSSKRLAETGMLVGQSSLAAQFVQQGKMRAHKWWDYLTMSPPISILLSLNTSLRTSGVPLTPCGRQWLECYCTHSWSAAWCFSRHTAAARASSGSLQLLALGLFECPGRYLGKEPLIGFSLMEANNILLALSWTSTCWQSIGTEEDNK